MNVLRMLNDSKRHHELLKSLLAALKMRESAHAGNINGEDINAYSRMVYYFFVNQRIKVY